MRRTPEQACAEIMNRLRKVLTIPVLSIEAGGSVPLGTYVGNPDIDIFILTKTIRGTMRDLGIFFPHGRVKQGELDIWYVPDMYGYEVDFVVLDPDHIKIQTLDHTKYYMEIMTDELRDGIRYWKRFFKRINMYGAEMGGVTGICITRLAELYPDKQELIQTLIDNLFNKEFIVEDPTLPGRDLLASMVKQKRWNLAYLSTVYGYNAEQYPDIDLEYFFDHYMRVYVVRRIKKMGTDREYQFVAKCIRKAWGEVRHRIQHFNAGMIYDTIFVPKDIYIGITVTPKELPDKKIIAIPSDKISDKAFEQIKAGYPNVKRESGFVTFTKKAPFQSVIKEFEKHLYNRLYELYIDVDRA